MSTRHDTGCSRRSFFARTGQVAVAASAAALPGAQAAATETKGHQRLGLDELRKWEALGYGMFLHFGMSTFVGNELPDGTYGFYFSNDKPRADNQLAKQLHACRKGGVNFLLNLPPTPTA